MLKTTFIFTITLIIGAACQWLLHPGLSIDQVQGIPGALTLAATTVTTLIFLMGWLGIGRKLTELLSLPPGSLTWACSVSMAIGVAGLTGLVLSWSGLLGVGTRWFLLIALSFGAIQFWQRKPPLAVGLLPAIVLLQLISAVKLQWHGDPLYYHLEAPRYWLTQGALQVDPHHPITFQSSLWEHIYLTAQLLFVNAPGKGLAAAQWSCQWIHVIAGFGGSAVALTALAQAIGLAAPIVGFFVLGGLATGPVLWTASLAKNDWGAVQLTLTSLALITYLSTQPRSRGSRAGALAAGLTAGWALMCKFTSLFLVLPTLAWGVALLLSQRKPRLILIALSGGLLSSLPYLVRNWTFTGDPFFPLLAAKLAQIPMGPTELMALSQTGKGASPFLSKFAYRASELWSFHSIGTLTLALPVVWGLKSKSRKALMIPAALGIAAFLLFVSLTGESAHFRLLGPALALLGAVGAATGAELVWAGFSLLRSRIPKLPSRVSAIAPWGFAAALQLLPLYYLLQLSPSRFEWPAQAVLSHSNGLAKSWLRTHAQPDELILLEGDNEVYHLGGWNVRISNKDPELDAWLSRRPALSPEELRSGLRARKVVWLAGGPAFGKTLLQQLEPFISRNPQAVAYREANQIVVDLSALDMP